MINVTFGFYLFGRNRGPSQSSLEQASREIGGPSTRQHFNLHMQASTIESRVAGGGGKKRRRNVVHMFDLSTTGSDGGGGMGFSMSSPQLRREEGEEEVSL